MNYNILDMRYIFRQIKKNFMLVFMCACIMGVAAYIVLDRTTAASYSMSVNLAVVPRDNVAGKMNEYNINAVTARNVNVLNSDTMKEQIKKAMGTAEIGGTVTAAVVPGTNLITMSSVSGSAERSFQILKAALETFPSLSTYFESGYLLKSLNSISGSGVTVEKGKTGFYAAAAAALTLLAGFGLIGCICLFTDRIHNQEQAEAILDMELLGSLPYIRKKSNQKAIAITEELSSPVYGEAIDQLTTQVEEKLRACQGKVLMVSSIKENDGKSTVAANLALNLMQRGKKVTIIDCDLRRPAMARFFDQEAEKKLQLSQYLKGKAGAEEIKKRLPMKEKYLECIWQISAVAEADKLLENGLLKKLLEREAAEADYVFLDTPPVGIVRDGEILAGYADAVLMVIRQDEVHGAAVNDVVDILDDAGAKMLGGVLNMVKGENTLGRGSYGKYYSRYTRS